MKRTLYEISLTCVSVSCFVFSDFPKTPLITDILSFYVLFLLSIALMYVVAPADSKLTTALIANAAEKRRIRFAAITAVNLGLIAVAFEPWLVAHGFRVHTPSFYWLNNNIGWAAVIILGFSFLLLPAYKALKLGKVARLIAKYLRKWHVPIAVAGILFVFYHVYLALVSGFKWNYTYLSGYAALLDLLALSLLGLLRFKKADRNLHKYLTYVLAVLIVLHYICSKWRL